MRTFSVMVVAVALFAFDAAAQRGGGGAGYGSGLGMRGGLPFRTYGSFSGFGSVVFPGTGNPPPLIDPFTLSFPGRLGAVVSGFPYTGAPSRGGRGGRGGAVAYPVPYPVFVGGYGYGYDPSYAYQQQPQQQPNVTIVMPPQGQQGPPVTINQNFLPGSTTPATSEQQQPPEDTSSGVRSYVAPSRPAAESGDDQVLFLVALKDSSVYTAVAYWVEGDTLHYITTQGKHNQVSLDLVDRDLCAKLNEGRKIDFRLPPPK